MSSPSSCVTNTLTNSWNKNELSWESSTGTLLSQAFGSRSLCRSDSFVVLPFVINTKMKSEAECCRAEKIKFAIYSKFREPRLYKYAARGDWDLVPKRCATHPKEASFVHKYPPGDTALHRILRASSVEIDNSAQRQQIEELKLRAVSALLSANPQAASQPDTFGRTPLHLACMDIENCGEAVAYMLVESCRKGVSRKDMEGRTPLHYLIGRSRDVPLALLGKMVTIAPQILTMQDAAKETPLDIANERSDEIEDVERVLHFLKTGNLMEANHVGTADGITDAVKVAPEVLTGK